MEPRWLHSRKDTVIQAMWHQHVSGFDYNISHSTFNFPLYLRPFAFHFRILLSLLFFISLHTFTLQSTLHFFTFPSSFYISYALATFQFHFPLSNFIELFNKCMVVIHFIDTRETNIFLSKSLFRSGIVLFIKDHVWTRIW